MATRKRRRTSQELDIGFQIEDFVSFGFSSSLFELGQLIYVPQDHCAYRLQRVRHSSGESDPIELTGTFVDWDGSKFVWKEKQITIKPFHDLKHITNLKVIPVKYHPQTENLLEELLARGSRFKDLAGIHYCQYEGNARLLCGKRINVSGPIIIDMCGWNFIQPGESSHSKHEWASHNLSTDDLYTLPSEMPAFSFNDKQWMFASVNSIKDSPSHNLIDQLVLRPNIKDLLLTMAKPIGKGIMIHLHGPAGTGKNMTAEAIAGKLNMPLFRADPEKLEHYRREGGRIKYLLARWNTIIVLEFCHTKQKNSALFTAFKDYKGSLVCISRHEYPVDDDLLKYFSCSVKYYILDQRRREIIWKIMNESLSLNLSQEQVKDLSNRKLNGHQISHLLEMIRRFEGLVDGDIELMIQYLFKPPKEIDLYN